MTIIIYYVFKLIELMKPEDVNQILLQRDPTSITSMLSSLQENRELDVLFQSVINLCSRQADDSIAYKLSKPVLDVLSVHHFQQLNAFVTHEHLKELLALLTNTGNTNASNSNAGHCKKNLVLLIRALICQAPLLSANHARELIKCDLLELCIQYWRIGDTDLAAPLTLCVLQTLLVELAYMQSVSTEKSQHQLSEEAHQIWERFLIGIEQHIQCDECALLQFGTLLLMLATTNSTSIAASSSSNAEKTINGHTMTNGKRMKKSSMRKIVKRLQRNKVLEKCTEILTNQNKANGTNFNGVEEVERQEIDCSYTSTIFDLLNQHFVPICQSCPSELHVGIINFMVEYAQIHNQLDHFLHLLATNTDVRYGRIGESVSAALLQALPNVARKYTANANGEIRWAKLAYEKTKKGKRQRRLKQQLDVDNFDQYPDDWNGLLAILQRCLSIASKQRIEDECAVDVQEVIDQKVGIALGRFSNATLEELIRTAPLQLLARKSSQSARLCLRLLCMIATLRKSLTIPFLAESFLELMLAEPEPRFQSLWFVTKMMAMYSQLLDQQPLLQDLCSLCLTMFIPLDHLDGNVPEHVKRQFLMAELAFFRSLLVNMPKFLSAMAPLIVHLLPEFFAQAAHYRKQLAQPHLSTTPTEEPNSYDCKQKQKKQQPDLSSDLDPNFPDRLEHALVGVCRAIGLRRKYFTRMLPFAVSNILSTLDREMRFPHFLLLSALDAQNDIALLSTNLPAIEKRKFALLNAQFYECNQIIG